MNSRDHTCSLSVREHLGVLQNGVLILAHMGMSGFPMKAQLIYQNLDLGVGFAFHLNQSSISALLQDDKAFQMKVVLFTRPIIIIVRFPK